MIAALLDSVMPEAARREDSSARDRFQPGKGRTESTAVIGWPIKDAHKKAKRANDASLI
jgi:hypothetical protein